mmetsp:Transcript_101902/g.228784  ORF Transcript_101902/g.228784 Transcript_101902/m.228784 type:complete len:351 (+) Transcript_101902:487-1539(+)
MVQGTPMPTKTFTELLPVTFTMDASAHSSARAAETEAKRSGIEVPSATKVMAVIWGPTSVTQPKSSAKSMTSMVTPPIHRSDNTKQSQPPIHVAGGTSTAKVSFHGRPTMWNNQSNMVGVSSPSATLQTESTTSSYHSRRLPPKQLGSGRLRMVRMLPRPRPSISFSFRMVTMSTPVRYSSLLAGFSTAPPLTSSRTMPNCRLSSPTLLGNSSTTTLACVAPGANSSSTSCSTKSRPAMALPPSVRHFTTTRPSVPRWRKTGIVTSRLSHPTMTSHMSSSKARTPAPPMLPRAAVAATELGSAQSSATQPGTSTSAPLFGAAPSEAAAAPCSLPLATPNDCCSTSSARQS